MADEERPRKSVTDLLVEIMEQADSIDDILILYSKKEGGGITSKDNDMTVADTIFLIETYKHWMMQKLLPNT